jgi:hypothetical protein
VIGPLASLALALAVAQAAPTFDTEPVAEPELDRPDDGRPPRPGSSQGANERLAEDIASTRGEVHLSELVDEVLADVVAEIGRIPTRWGSPLAIRSVRVGANVEPAYARKLEAALVSQIHAGTGVRVVECLECRVARTQVVGGSWTITRGLVDADDARRVAARIGARAFLDASFGFSPETGVVELDFKVVRAADGVVLWADTFRADETTPMLLRSSSAPQRRKDRLRDLESLLEGRPYYGMAVQAGFMLLPYDDPVDGDITGATAGFRVYERFGVDRRVLFGLDLAGFINTSRLAGGVISAGAWWVVFRPDLVHPELRLGGKAGAFLAGSEGNAAVFQLGGELLLRYRFGLYAYALFMTTSQFNGRDLGGLGFALGLSFNL